MKNYIFKIIILFFCVSVQAQGVFYENINAQAGLPSENIYDIYKDSKGYMWFSSEIGLLRFNGNSFKLFESNSSLSKSGSYIKEDLFGRIWYQSFDGYFFYTENDTLKQLASKESSGFKSYAMSKNYLYRVIDKGIEEIDLKTLRQKVIIKGSSFVFCHILDDWLYYGDKTIYRYHLKTKTVEKVITLENDFKSLVTFSNKKWIAIADRSKPQSPFILLNSSGIVAKNVLKLPESLQNLYLLDDEIWCLTKNGIYRIDYKLQPKADFHFLIGKNVSSYTKDSNNFIWIGSPTNGIYVIKDLLSKEFSLPNDEFSSISQKNGVVYTGTNGGKIYKHSPNLDAKLFHSPWEMNYFLRQAQSAVRLCAWLYVLSQESFPRSGSPAEKAGLRQGDIITEFDGQTITGMTQLKQLIASHKSGDEVKMTMERLGNGYKEKSITVTLAAQSDFVSESSSDHSNDSQNSQDSGNSGDSRNSENSDNSGNSGFFDGFGGSNN